MAANASGLLVIERILRDRQGIWQQVVEDRELPRLIGQMLLSSAAALACYGVVLGSFHSVAMAATSAVKLPLLFLVTLAICLPTLYLFNLVFGARLSVRQSLALVMVAITVTAMLALAFAPISLFFLITAPDYGFFKLLNVVILALSALVGLRFLTGGMRVLNEHGLLAPARAAAPATAGAASAVLSPPSAVAQPAVAQPVEALVPAGATAATTAAPTAANGVTHGAVPATVPPGLDATGRPVGDPVSVAHPMPVIPPGYVLQPVGRNGGPAPRRPDATPTPPSMTLLYIWILLFGFVGTQLAWTLRPFFGSPGMKFSLYRDIDGNFYAEIIRTLANL
ncbi:MAG TPA: hypothetical protein VF657_06400, partial [Actinoplanes sp.]